MPDRSYTLSLAMIVKNEAETLEKCLSTARPHVDEIVVVDTGSTDGTRAIAQRYADVFDEIEWPDSFSLARNHSFDLATGDYIIWLDGDEYIEAEADWHKIHGALGQANVTALRLLIRNVFSGKQLLDSDRAWLIRVVRNHPMIRFTGRVHNQVSQSLRQYNKRFGGTAADIDAEIVHVGYALSADQSKEKYNPRLALLQHEVDNANDPTMRSYYRYQLGVGHYMVKEYEAADRVLDQVEYEHLSNRNAYYTRFLAGDAACRTQHPRRALVHATHMMERKPEEPLGYVLAGKILKGEGDIEESLLLFEAALKRCQEGGETVRFILDEAILKKQIASLALKLGLLQRAQSHLAAYLAAYPDDDQAEDVLQKLEDKIDQRNPVSTA